MTNPIAVLLIIGSAVVTFKAVNLHDYAPTGRPLIFFTAGGPDTMHCMYAVKGRSNIGVWRDCP